MYSVVIKDILVQCAHCQPLPYPTYFSWILWDVSCCFPHFADKENRLRERKSYTQESTGRRNHKVSEQCLKGHLCAITFMNEQVEAPMRLSNLFINELTYLFIFASTGVWTQCSTFCFGYFWDRVYYLCLGRPGPQFTFYLPFPHSWDDRHIPPLPAFIDSNGVSQTFLLGLAWNHHSPNLYLQSSYIPDLSHYTLLRLSNLRKDTV
jgi:hypothetical protein